MNDAVNLSLHALQLGAISIVIWNTAGGATWPQVVIGVGGGLMVVACMLAIAAARSWGWTRQ